MRRLIPSAAAICLTLFCAACSRSPQVSFYTLEPGARLEAPVADRQAPSLAVGPVTLPEMVERPQLVVRVAANRVDILETHRWAEPLKSELPRLIAQNLRQMLGWSRAASYQQYAGSAADYRVLVDFVRFESVPGDAVTIEAAWTVRRGAGGAPGTGRSLLREKIAGPGYDELVAAYSRAIAGLSGELARELRAEEAAAH